MPRKPKTQEPITPQELSALNDKTTQNPAVRKYHVATDAKNIVGLKKRRRILRIILGAVTAVLLILFIISMLVSKWGDLVIEIDRPLQSRGIVLSTDPEFKTKSVALSAKQALNVTNTPTAGCPPTSTPQRTASTTAKTMSPTPSTAKTRAKRRWTTRRPLTSAA